MFEEKERFSRDLLHWLLLLERVLSIFHSQWGTGKARALECLGNRSVSLEWKWQTAFSVHPGPGPLLILFLPSCFPSLHFCCQNCSKGNKVLHTNVSLPQENKYLKNKQTNSTNCLIASRGKERKIRLLAFVVVVVRCSLKHFRNGA